LIDTRIQEVSEFIDGDLGEVMNIYIIGPGDTANELERAMGVPVTTYPLELMEEHSDWFELTYILRSDGFGAVVFIPKLADIHPTLLGLCTQYSEGAS
jgi:hypothetical protein